MAGQDLGGKEGRAVTGGIEGIAKAGAILAEGTRREEGVLIIEGNYARNVLISTFFD